MTRWLALVLLVACGGPEGRTIYVQDEPGDQPSCVFAGLYEVTVTEQQPGCGDSTVVVAGSDFQNEGACTFDERSADGSILASFECEPGSPVVRCTGLTLSTANGCAWDTSLRRR